MIAFLQKETRNMIANSVFSSSSWQSDPLFPVQEESTFETNLLLTEENMNRLPSGFDFEFDLQQIESQLCADSSVASSESSIDDFYVEEDFVIETDDLLSFCESLGSPLRNSFEPTSFQQDVDLTLTETDLTGGLKQAFDKNSNLMTSQCTVDNATSHHNINAIPHEECTPSQDSWKILNTQEKKLAEEFAELLTEDLGLRERLDVLRIINPNVQHNPTTSELHIDPDDFSEEKLDRVREYLHQHHRQNDFISDVSSDMEYRPQPKRDSDSSSDSCQSPPPHKRLTKKQKREQQRLERLRRQKEARQVQKERRSGLFKSEQVLSLSQESRDVAEEEVDIVT